MASAMRWLEQRLQFGSKKAISMMIRISVSRVFIAFWVIPSIQLPASTPAISEQPVGQTVLMGSSIELRVGVTSSEPVSYQWFRGQITQLGKLATGTNATLVLSNIGLDGGGGDYRVVVTNSSGSITSSIAPITVVRFLPGTDVTAAQGARVPFSVEKNGRPVKVQWFKDGEALTSNYSLFESYVASLYTLGHVTGSNAGRYCVVVSNEWGVVRPPCRALSVVAPGPLDALHPIGQSPLVNLINLERHNGLFFALGGYQIATSTNGTDWVTISNYPSNYYDATWGNGVYVSVGGPSRVYTSPDGTNWSQQAIRGGVLRAVTYGGGVFVVAAEQDIFSSPDGTNWTMATPAVVGGYQDVVWGGGRFVLMGGPIQTSTNGLFWEASATQKLGWFPSVAYGNGRFVAVGNYGLTMTSYDGLAWVTHSSGTIEWFSRVTYGNGVFLGITRSSTLLSSPDGISWTIRARGTNSLIEPQNNLGVVCAANGTFIIEAANRVLLETDPFTMLQLSTAPTPTIYLHGIVGRPHQIEALDPSSPEMRWRVLDTVIPDASPFLWVDPAPSARHRIYRATSP